VKLRGALRRELAGVSTRRPDIHPDDFVFATARGGRLRPDNFRPRVLQATVKWASANLTRRGLPPLPERITPHSLRRTFASVLYAIGEDPGVVMDEMGHTDPGVALRVYRQAMRRAENERNRLRALTEHCLE
jgi:integrase